jgi:hypothetical protein
MKRSALPQKLKMLLQQEIDSLCPFCGGGDVDHFQFHHINENPSNNDPDNILMVCPTCHSKITKGDIDKSEVVNKKKSVSSGKIKENLKMGQLIYFNSKVRNAVVGDNNKVTINVKSDKKQSKKSKYPEGCIGANVDKANYISYLITRYHEYKEWHVGKGNMNYAMLQSHIKKKYKIGSTRSLYHIPEHKFEELAGYIQERIDGTVLANVKRSKGDLRNYSTFEEYLSETKA